MLLIIFHTLFLKNLSNHIKLVERFRYFNTQKDILFIHFASEISYFLKYFVIIDVLFLYLMSLHDIDCHFFAF